MKPGMNNPKRGRGGRNFSGKKPMRGPSSQDNGGTVDVRMRGNIHQMHEKYLSLARDATSSGDRVAAENYFQHAEHYYRVLSQINLQMNQRRQQEDENGQPYLGNQGASQPDNGQEYASAPQDDNGSEDGNEAEAAPEPRVFTADSDSQPELFPPAPRVEA
jgi:hypothetical protein